MIERCDYKGAHYDHIDYINSKPGGTENKFIPEYCAHEVGGVIGVNAASSGAYEATETTITFTATISPRASGVHIFWVEADDGAFLYITHSSGKRTQVVDNSGFHGPQWKQGAITLLEGERYELKVYWGNAASTGKLQVLFEDPLSDGDAMASFTPILV